MPRGLLLASILAAGCAVLLGRACRATADPPGKDVLLARVCVSEAGWLQASGSNANDCPMIVLVLERRAAAMGVSFEEAMRRYSPRATGTRPARTERGRWVADLGPELRQPIAWPAGVRWEGSGGYMQRWRARLREARTLLARPPEWRAICDAPPDHWGGGMDTWRAVAEGWRAVDCGRTHNRGWCAPRGNPDCRALTLPAAVARGAP